MDSDVCSVCGNPSDALISDEKDNSDCLCQDCHNEAMLEILDSVVIDDKLIGRVCSCGEIGECVISFDGKLCSWETLGRFASTYEGWNIRIEFGSGEDEFD